MRRLLTVVATVGCFTSGVLAWSAHGHRTITYLALDGLPSEAPDWLKDQSVRNRIADESNEPDRWRGLQNPILGHENNLEHYLDIEDLTAFGLTLETVSPFRYEFTRDMAVAMYVHPENWVGGAGEKPYDPKTDKDQTKRWPGFLPHAINEHYEKLRSSFNTLRILESLNDPARAEQVTQARENCINEMGMLSHFVGDAAQPLHTTRHHHGWVGDNPNGYTTKSEIHAHIDGTIVDFHHLSFTTLRPLMTYDAKVDAKDPWKDTLAYIRRSFDKVEPLYKLEHEGKLNQEEGKELITSCFKDAGSTLSALYWAAWTSSAPDERQVQAWVKYNNFKPETAPEPKKPAPEGGGEPQK